VVSDRIDDTIKSIHRRPTGVKLKDISEYDSASDYLTLLTLQDSYVADWLSFTKYRV
jgi:hypothetical protein